jgi:uncharacterized protein involved in propanediol utilization
MLQIDTPRPAPAVAAAGIASGVCHGTLGELIQGPVMHEGKMQIGLISLPVQRYSWMHFVAGEDGEHAHDLPHKEKCRRAIALYLARHERCLPRGRWLHDSELLQGKGMASSTADIVASIRCLDRVFGLRSTPELIADILRQVERSDSVFLNHYALYLSARQCVLRYLPHDPHFHVCYIDEGDTVLTEAVTATLLDHYAANLDVYESNLRLTLAAFDAGDRIRIARCASVSAALAQQVLPKRHYSEIVARRAAFGADGIVVAHTGSLIGYLFAQAPDAVALGELSAFFRGLGHQCRFAQTGF